MLSNPITNEESTQHKPNDSAEYTASNNEDHRDNETQGRSFELSEDECASKHEEGRWQEEHSHEDEYENVKSCALVEMSFKPKEERLDHQEHIIPVHIEEYDQSYLINN